MNTNMAAVTSVSISGKRFQMCEPSEAEGGSTGTKIVGREQAIQLIEAAFLSDGMAPGSPPLNVLVTGARVLARRRWPKNCAVAVDNLAMWFKGTTR